MPRVRIVCDECEDVMFYVSSSQEFAPCPRCKKLIEVDPIEPREREDD